jgi:rhodanese-related sulfurtransferase
MFLEFLAEQWLLVGALVSCVLLLIFHETRRGGPALTPNQLVRMVNQQQAVVVDLREQAEFRKGHIADARNIPYAKLDERMGELEKLKDRPIVLVCKLGQHASAAAKRMQAKGFTQVHRLGGGLTEWQGSQLPLVKE